MFVKQSDSHNKKHGKVLKYKCKKKRYKCKEKRTDFFHVNTPLQGEITVSDENIIANICLKINRKEIKTERMFLK